MEQRQQQEWRFQVSLFLFFSHDLSASVPSSLVIHLSRKHTHKQASKGCPVSCLCIFSCLSVCLSLSLSDATARREAANRATHKPHADPRPPDWFPSIFSCPREQGKGCDQRNKCHQERRLICRPTCIHNTSSHSLILLHPQTETETRLPLSPSLPAFLSLSASLVAHESFITFPSLIWDP